MEQKLLLLKFKNNRFFSRDILLNCFTINKIVAFMFLLSSGIFGQVNRNDTRSSIPYRANYQRMATSGSARHCMEIRKENESHIWGWGYNGYKQLNKYKKQEFYSPRKQQDTDGAYGKWISIVTGGSHSLGIRADGSLWAWGYNDYGQLGLGDADKHIGVTRVGTDNNWVSVAAGFSHSLALKSDGSLWGWGLNVYGQVGTGFIDQPVYPPGTVYKPLIMNYINKPTKVGDKVYTNIAAGNYFSMALMPNTADIYSGIYMWGLNGDGQLGDKSSDLRKEPTKISKSDKDFVSIAAGGNFALAVKSNGTMWSWGANDEGQLGLGSNEEKDKKNEATQVGKDINWVKVNAGGKHALALKSNGTLWSWGCNDFHQSVRRDSLVGCGDTVNVKSIPRLVDNSRDWVSIEAGESHSLALKANGRLYSWGHNNLGQLGVDYFVNPIGGDSIKFQKPVYMSRPESSKWLKVSICGTHILALKSNGRIYEDKNETGFVKVNEDSTWVSIAAGKEHSLALKADGSLWSWGNNKYGQLGDSTKVDSFSPKQIGIMKVVPPAADPPKPGTLVGITPNPLPKKPNNDYYDWVSIAANNFSSYALRSDGTIWSWGNNKNGQLGDKTANTDRLAPVQMWSAKSAVNLEPEKSSKWVSISASTNSFAAITTDGRAWLCGDNNKGKLGFIEPDITYSDKWFLRNQGWYTSSISIGGSHTAALKTNGMIWTWGSNIQHQLGHEEYVIKCEEYPVLKDKAKPNDDPDKKWIAVTTGTYSTFGIKADGTLWGWGWNGENQLGVETPTPLPSGALIGWDPNYTAQAFAETLSVITNYSPTDPVLPVNGMIGTEIPLQIGTDKDWVSVVSGAFETIALKSNGEMYRWGKTIHVPTLVPN